MRQRYEIPEPGQPFDPAIYRLGSPCKRSHLWDEGVTLRTIKGGKCPTCQRIDALARHSRLKEADLDTWKAKQREVTQRHRAKHGRPSRSKNGLPHGFLEANGFNNCQAATVVKLLADGLTIEQIQERVLLDRCIRAAGAPSVARLVYQQQIEHWRAHPEERAEFIRQRGVRQARWRYMIDGSFRLYHRAKSKERKARERGSRTVHLSPDQMWRRWVEFGHCCAYCGAGGDLQVEHVIPISQGGEHHLGNIVPACSTCNYSKGTSPVREWYQAQPFFTESRWLAILKALDRGQPTTEQLAITLSL
jgi:5-methylcytosine-specific restriction endonuclease McrA